MALAAVAAGGVVYLSVFDTLLLLRWLGVFAILFTAFIRVVSYSSPSVSILLCIAVREDLSGPALNEPPLLEI